ncbi:hypothetical protein TCAL_12366 [Tigriopus californicus]|uniref:U5 small nuclear ribonucleoprotein 40 kDa protein n=1 Tax=Tigriopus californicus TaxID=6832 RepID=A0A553P317_TIGCA|nr:hypothetical protein TCAL_12366 [Tigriopus californicus]
MPELKRAHSPDPPPSASTQDPPPPAQDEHAVALKKARPESGYEVGIKDPMEQQQQLQKSGPPRMSNMESAIMLLAGGHQGEIFSAKFHPDGQILASGGFDRTICLWNVYGECENYHVISAVHSGAILDLHFSYEDGQYLYTASTDKTVGIFNTRTGQRLKRLKGHTNYVNSVHPARRGDPLVVSGSDDCSIRVWDQRKRNSVQTLNSMYQVTAVTFNDTAEQVISAGIDNQVKIWDLRKPTQPAYMLPGHTDTITGISLSPDGSYVLTNAMDNTLRIWDIRPFVQTDRCTKIITGGHPNRHQHNFEKNLLKCCWSPDGAMVSAGSSDRFVYIWDTSSRRILYKLPGHLGAVNDIDFHKVEPIILSASSDRQIYLGEFEP